MPRGKLADVGAERTSANGYHYTKTADRGWVLTHWLTAEKTLGRQLKENEMVKFVDPKFKRDPKNPAGVKVIVKKTSSLRKREAQIEARITELQAELKAVRKEIEARGV